jgi:type IX secretion system PorP/SprF family membrane protein
MFTYAYHIFGPYYNSSKFSFGLSGGFLFMNTNMDNYYLQHPEDPYINDRAGSYMAFEMGLGLNYIYRNKFQVSFSAPQLFNPGLSVDDEGYGKFGLKPHFIFGAKGILDLPDGLNRIEPMAMVRMGQNVPYQIDLAVQYTYDNLFWGCLAYRTDYAATLSAGVILHAFRFGLSRDFALGRAAGTLGSATEIMLGYKFKHIPKESYAGKRGVGSTIRHKVYHPSNPNPLPGQNKKQNRKPKVKKKYRKI